MRFVPVHRPGVVVFVGSSTTVQVSTFWGVQLIDGHSRLHSCLRPGRPTVLERWMSLQEYAVDCLLKVKSRKRAVASQMG